MNPTTFLLYKCSIAWSMCDFHYFQPEKNNLRTDNSSEYVFRESCKSVLWFAGKKKRCRKGWKIGRLDQCTFLRVGIKSRTAITKQKYLGNRKRVGITRWKYSRLFHSHRDLLFYIGNLICFLEEWIISTNLASVLSVSRSPIA